MTDKRMIPSEETTAGRVRQSVEGERCPKCRAELKFRCAADANCYARVFACSSGWANVGQGEEFIEGVDCLRRQLAAAQERADANRRVREGWESVLNWHLTENARLRRVVEVALHWKAARDENAIAWTPESNQAVDEAAEALWHALADLGRNESSSDLSAYTDGAILDEITRRGWQMVRIGEQHAEQMRREEVAPGA